MLPSGLVAVATTLLNSSPMKNDSDVCLWLAVELGGKRSQVYLKVRVLFLILLLHAVDPG
jgi:hypothetical protein